MTAPTLLPTPNPPRRNPARQVRLTGRPRRLARAAHVIVSSGWLGLSVAMVTLATGAALSADPTFAAVSYHLMTRIGTVVIASFAIATLVSGALLSLLTPWGFVRHHWVVAKLVLTVTVIVTASGSRTAGWRGPRWGRPRHGSWSPAPRRTCCCWPRPP